MTAKTMHQTEADLRAALTTLAERWEQCADALTRDLPTDLFIESDSGTEWGATLAHGYRTSARDLREVLATSRIPNALMTAAEEEQYSTREENAS